ncbi:helix-turn-helix transcriptional regulator [Actinoplanes sp. LDG1-01]|uniref:Helix-turn-helix transcriptional regulator n=2 Tax=Paractinoplanes lichenicola TaxID=2802976 RepID=A0ABS1VF61_9ACTN|nr:helix-turn-helix transcriptional regulator [Actinoplanes lichenicola]
MIVKVLAEAGQDVTGRASRSGNEPTAGRDELGFAELLRRVPGISHKMLSQTLRALAADGLVDRRVEDSVPPRVYYRLTALGRSLDEPLAALREWAERHMPDVDDFARRTGNRS